MASARRTERCNPFVADVATAKGNDSAAAMRSWPDAATMGSTPMRWRRMYTNAIP